MKILTIILSLFLLNVCLVATGAPLVGVDASRIESIAMKAIANKYADLKPSDLVFDGIQYSMKADGSEAVTVTYNLPASAKQEETSNGGVTTYITHTQNIIVTLSNDGKVTNLSKGSGMIYSSGAK